MGQRQVLSSTHNGQNYASAEYRMHTSAHIGHIDCPANVYFDNNKKQNVGKGGKEGIKQTSKWKTKGKKRICLGIKWERFFPMRKRQTKFWTIEKVALVQPQGHIEGQV